LIFKENKVVQPHYIIRPQECTGKEIDTMHNIRRQLFRKYPNAREYLLPTQYLDNEKIDDFKKITEEYEKIKEEKFISIQYEMIARYCEQHNLEKIEIGIEKGCHTHHYIKDFIKESGDSNFEIDQTKSPKSFYSLLKYFRFPLLKYNKSEMESISKKEKWLDLMKLTWFCRRPRKGRPCGFCGPCTDTFLAGLGWRLPISSRIIAYIQLPFRNWWRENYKKRSTGFYKYIKELLKHRA